MISKLLIANRGEIAVRIARTAARMGLRTVAVYSDADRAAPHVRACDEAVHIGPAAAAESYLRTEKIIDAAKRTGADAIHPGYGFLSENAEFADALEEAGLTFVGPKAETIRKMGSKAAAKDLMEAAGVPTTPGYQGEDQSLRTMRAEAERIGYPVLLKATAGGGGKGMRLVEKDEDLADALDSARREARAAFGDDRFLIEKYIPVARHVEVQIFGDGRGNVLHMFERDCSVQRRHQKVIEEAPAPNMPRAVRQKLLEAGVAAGKAVDYRGAGTVEFLYDGGENVFFMEMNTRLQVEHPVSEIITGFDFVELQLRIAQGEGLPCAQEDIVDLGHAVEARLYAEDPENDFAPSVGTLTTLDLPENEARIDSGVAEGQEITPHYDPMIAKIITRGPNRAAALNTLSMALENTRVAGVETNAVFLHRLAGHDDFRSGEVSTRFIENHEEALFGAPSPTPEGWAALALHQFEAARPDRWTGFRLNRAAHASFWVEAEGQPSLLHLYPQGDDLYELVIEPDTSAVARREGRLPGTPERHVFRGKEILPGCFEIEYEGRRSILHAAPHRNGLRVWHHGETMDVPFPDPLSGSAGHHVSEGSLTAPMPGVVTLISLSPGDTVEAGATLLVMEAMKMEHAVKAPHDGVVKDFKFSVGDQVREGDLLVEFEESA